MKPVIAFVAAVALIVSLGSPAFAHCEMPCGIYDDQARIDQISEEITTIEKSMNTIIALSKEDPINYNQLVRWIDNKENHANELQHVVTQYFMTQRIKPVAQDDEKAYAAYVKQLTLLHEMLIYAMKAKQTTDLKNVKKLRSLLADFHTAYFDEGAH